MSHTIQDIGIASQIGAYSDAIEVEPDTHWLLTSGTPGLSRTSELPMISQAKRNLLGSMLVTCWSVPI